jgi:hypothetical protein
LNKVLVVPFDGVIEQEPLAGGEFIIKLIELLLISDGNE